MPPETMQDLKAEVNRLREIVTLNSDWIWEVNAEGKYVYSSPVGSVLLGYAEDEILGKNPMDFMVPEELESVGKLFQAKFERQEWFSGLINRNRRKDGRVIVLETSGVPIYTQDGTFNGYRGIDRDVTSLWSREFLLEALYDSAPVALYVEDREYRFSNVNETMAFLCGVKAEELVGRSVSDFIPWSESGRSLSDFVIVDAGGMVPRRNLEWNGLHYEVIVKPLTDLSGRIIGLTSALIDITERVRAERALEEAKRRLESYAGQDYLTGLLNRRYFDELLIRSVRAALRERKMVSVIMGDIDFFKKYNDRYGHQAGDVCLRTVAQTLHEVIKRPEDAVGRYGGEEFVILLPNTGTNGAIHVAEAMRTAVEELHIPHEDSNTGHVTMSFGVATVDILSVIPDGMTPWGDLVRRADEALYRAKSSGRNTVC